MKILITLGLFVLSALATTAQTTARYAKTSGGAVVLDTSTNATQRYMYSPVFQPAKPLHSVQYVGTKLSGYIKGSVALLGSVDGTNFTLASNDSITLSNATTNTYIWDISNKLRRYYKVRITTIDSSQSLKSAVHYLAQ